MRPKRRPKRRRDPTRDESLLIENMAPTGEGVARLDGKAVFVPQTLPGERARVRVHTGYKVWRGELLALEQASQDRVEPSCPHASRCGGCNWMHVASEARERLHREHVVQALQSVAKLEAEALVYHRPTSETGYRTRARWHLSAPSGVGFLRPRSKKLVRIDRCQVLDPALAELPSLLAQLLKNSKGQGEALTALGFNGLPVLELRWKGDLGVDAFGLAARWIEEGRFAGIRFWPEEASRPTQWGDPRPQVTSADGRRISMAPDGFSQASQAGGALLAERVASLLGPVSGRLIELFAGSGTLTMALAGCLQGDGASLVAVEEFPDAVEQLRENLRLHKVERSKVKVADANTFVLPRPIRAVVLDPPRGGAPGSCEQIVRARPRRVVYVSCNPATLARDLLVLTGGGYRIAAVELFDLFAQTSHLETVVLLER